MRVRAEEKARPDFFKLARRFDANIVPPRTPRETSECSRPFLVYKTLGLDSMKPSDPIGPNLKSSGRPPNPALRIKSGPKYSDYCHMQNICTDLKPCLNPTLATPPPPKCTQAARTRKHQKAQQDEERPRKNPPKITQGSPSTFLILLTFNYHLHIVTYSSPTSSDDSDACKLNFH